jgi:Na+/H+ antiporter NhaC
LPIAVPVRYHLGVAITVGPCIAMSTDTDPDPDPTAPTITWRRVVGFIAAAIVLLAVLPSTDPPRETADALTTQFAVRNQANALQTELSDLEYSPDSPLVAALEYRGPADAEDSVRRELTRVDALVLSADSTNTLSIDTTRAPDARRLQLEVTLRTPEAASTSLVETERRTGGWVAILPPLLAVLLALFFRRIVVALLGAVWLGAALQTGFDPLAATWMTTRDYLWGAIADSFSLYIIGFTFALVGMVHVIIRMGGVAGLLEAFSWLAHSARSTRVATSLMGLALFFDDYANTIVVGSTMRPLTDRQKISREKLAYLVDSTSAPIAGLAVISTWIGYEVGLFDELSRQLQMGLSGYEIFFQILPLRFYCILTLVFVFLIAISGRDFGPMLDSEIRARTTGEVHPPDATPLSSAGGGDAEPKAGIPHRWYNAVVPVACVVVGTLLGLYWSGWRGPDGTAIPGLGQLVVGEASLGTFVSTWGLAAGDLIDWTVWREALSNAANARVLFWGSLFGSLVAVGLAVGQRLLGVVEALTAWARAIPMMRLAVAILVLAWAIQGVCSDLGTSIYLVGSVQHLVTPAILPLLTFLLAAVVAFATGTSWGTMGILLPAMIPMAFHMTSGMPDGQLVLLMCFGAVLDGAIFGDHCSPISDTTVMSSIASSVDHIEHVRTQFPYALTSMATSVVFGYVGVAFGLPIWAAFGLGAIALAGVLVLVGREPSAEARSSTGSG